MTAPAFGPAVAPDHVRLDAADYESIAVVGDVHGCLAELRALWDRLAPGPDDLVVFVGDLVRKGPDSDAVVEFVRTREAAISVRGNNEQMVLRREATADLSPANRRAIESFPLVVSWDGAMVVHGGVSPDRPLADHTPDDLLEARAIPPENGYDGPFWFDTYAGPPRILFGHTVLADPLVEEWAVGLDTGCVHGGALTAYEWGSDTVLSVPAERSYVPRSDDQVLAR